MTRKKEMAILKKFGYTCTIWIYNVYTASDSDIDQLPESRNASKRRKGTLLK